MEENKSYITGIIGALIGGLVGTIPWVLMYVYANMIWSLLALIVGICSLKGYELFKGKVDNKLPIIIAITTFISITIATLVIIPNLLILKEFHVITLANFKLFYSTQEFRSAILGDYALSLLFAILGMIGIIRSIKNQVDLGSNKIDLKYNPNKVEDEEVEKVKKVFNKYNAFDKNNTVSLDTLRSELSDIDDRLKFYLMQNIIKVKNKEYYFNLKRNNNKKIGLILLIVGLSLMLIGIILMNIPSHDNNPVKEKEVIYEVLNNYQEYDNDNNGYYYVPNIDLSGKSGFIDVSYYDDGISYSDFNEVASNIKKGLELEETEIKDFTIYDNNKNNKVIYFSASFDDFEEYIYYVFKDTKYAIIDGFNYHDNDNSNISIDAKKIADSFDFK